MQGKLTGGGGSGGWFPTLRRGLTIAAAIIAISLPALPQVATGTLNAVFCSVPATPTGTTSATGTTPIAVNCAAPGATPALQNIQFAAEARVPTSFVLATQAPVLPAAVFNNLKAGTSELRQFVSLSGSILTFDLLEVTTGTALPFSASLPTGTATLVEPTGTLINEIRIKVQNVIVTGGMHPTMLFSGVVTTPSTTGTTVTGIGEAGIPITAQGTGAPGSPLSPNLFGNVQGMAASVSLAFNNTFPFPGIRITTTTNGTTTTTASTAPFGTSGAVPITFLSVGVAGAFDLASPTGFALVAVVSGSTTGTTPGGTPGTTPSNGEIPVIQLAPFTLQTTSRTITLDASQSSSPIGSPITFSWTSSGGVSISGANTATPAITFPSTGTFPIQLTVTDGSGVQSSVILPFVVTM